jgi:hypothetical protein
LKKKILSIFIIILVIMLTYSCVSLKPLPGDLERFDRAKEVSDSELDGIYDHSRLKVGSRALLKLRGPSFDLLLDYELVAIDDATQKCVLSRSIMNQEGNGRIFTQEVESTFIRKVFMSGKVKTLSVAEVDSNQFESITRAAIKNLLIGGALGFGIDVIPRATMRHRGKVVTDRLAQATKENEDYYKIIELTRMSDEELSIGNRQIVCRVYQVEAMSKTIMVTDRQSEPFYVVRDMSRRVWISDDVPFGIVKVESKGTLDLAEGKKAQGMRASGSTELVDFKY